MTFFELQILLDINKGNEANVLKKHASEIKHSYFFVDSEDGHCYLFDRNGKLDDIKKIDTIYEDYVKKDIKKIAIPKGVKSIGNYVFDSYASLTNIEIPNGVESIGNGAFWNCESLTNIAIPKGVKRIGAWAFAYCTSLQSIKIPESVESIGDRAFSCCTSLKKIIFKGKTIDQVKAMDNYPWGIEVDYQMLEELTSSRLFDIIAMSTKT